MEVSLNEQLEKDAGLGVPDITDRDMACVILPALDYEAQLVAISALLHRNKAADAETTAQLKELDDYAKRTSGFRSERAVDEWVDLMGYLTYQDAAHSMAALGMIVPLYESLLFQAFQGIRAKYFGVAVIPLGHERSGFSKPEDFWDCHKVFQQKPNIVRGVVELAEAIGLALPAEFVRLFRALYRYRNKMFHFGFEWPTKECEEFATAIEDEGWFSKATLADERTPGDVRFIFYMTPELIELSLDVIPQLLAAFGSYCRNHRPID